MDVAMPMVIARAADFGLRGDKSAESLNANGETLAESREAFFADSDVVSLHVRLKPATRGIVTGRDLGLMRPDALFVNTSRAGLVEPGALLAAIDTERPGMARHGRGRRVRRRVRDRRLGSATGASAADRDAAYRVRDQGRVWTCNSPTSSIR